MIETSYIRPGLPGRQGQAPEPPAEMIEIEPYVYVNRAAWTADTERIWRAAKATKSARREEAE